MAAETKAIALRYPSNFSLLSLVKRKVYFRVKSRIISKVINCWRDNAVFDSQYGSNSFNRAGST